MLTQVSREEMLGLVATKLKSKYLPDLAKDIGVSTSCLYNIANRKTKWPRWNTFQKLLPKLNLVLTITEQQYNKD